MISSIELVNFKLHKELSLSLKDEKVAIIGPNASGKTSILEALYYAFMSKPLIGNQSNIINRDNDYMKLNVYFGSEKKSDLEYRLKSSPKSIIRKITLNGVKKKPQDIVGTQPVIFFNAEDNRIINDSPSYRRNFINNTIIQSSRKYLDALLTFNKIINQRNKLLQNIKNNKSTSKDQLFVYNLQLSEPISVIYKYIDILVKELNKKISTYYSEISKTKEEIRIDYINTLPSEKGEIIKALEDNELNDISRGFTTKGPHKDDLIIKINGFNTRNSLSRGECRSLALAIKNFEADYIRESTGLNPILLLDDVMGELDSGRRKSLSESILAKQTIITSTELDDNIFNYKLIEI